MLSIEKIATGAKSAITKSKDTAKGEDVVNQKVLPSVKIQQNLEELQLKILS